MKILICDDHAIFREGLRLVLAEFDAELVEAASSDQALEIVGSQEVDLVLLDLEMPGSPGWTALRRLRSEHPVVPVVIVSASEKPGDARRALDEGASGFIPKSSSAQVLRSALQLVLSGGVYIPAAALTAAAQEPAEEPARAARRERAGQLTPRQLEVLELMSKGLTNRDIARVLEIAEGTVKTHIAAILEILDVSNRTEAAMVMRELDLVPEGE